MVIVSAFRSVTLVSHLLHVDVDAASARDIVTLLTSFSSHVDVDAESARVTVRLLMSFSSHTEVDVASALSSAAEAVVTSSDRYGGK